VTRGAASNGPAAEADLLRGIEIAERTKSPTEYFRGLNNLAEHHLKAAELSRMTPIYAKMRAEETELGLTVQLRWPMGRTSGTSTCSATGTGRSSSQPR
jgi:hypothetical protein